MADADAKIEQNILHLLSNKTVRQNVGYFHQRAIEAEEQSDDIILIEKYIREFKDGIRRYK